jgi:hypothetical protein
MPAICCLVPAVGCPLHAHTIYTALPSSSRGSLGRTPRCKTILPP